ncbi:otoferlin [Caerostris extrusa]|uniref:Otoferlin n=1 Tax=Caerostris extrusa TaxID=172846 RepID=A0AAV4USH3_CAEEX|nr:otoferlin [Caerostris extrusa]
MIDRKVGEKPIYFEVTLGNAGNMLDGYRTTSKTDDEDLDSGSDSGDGSFYGETSCPVQSTTPPLKPTTKDRSGSSSEMQRPDGQLGVHTFLLEPDKRNLFCIPMMHHKKGMLTNIAPVLTGPLLGVHTFILEPDKRNFRKMDFNAPITGINTEAFVLALLMMASNQFPY